MRAFEWFIGIVGALAVSALSGMVNDEVRGQLNRIPYAVLRLARRRVPIKLRIRLYDDEWLPELQYIMDRDEERPISRLFTGTAYALGLLRSARKISRDRARLAADVESQRLVSLSILTNAIGNIVFAGVGYALTFVLGFTASVAFITILGLVNSGLWLPIRVFLAIVFGPGLCLLFGFAANRGIRAIFRVAIVPPPEWVSQGASSSAPGTQARAMSTLANLLAVRGNSFLSAAAASVACLGGVNLALFEGLSPGRIYGMVLTAVVVISGVGIVRLLLVDVLQRSFQRQNARKAKAAER